ncbi:MAG: efflux RND transporter permease subunit [Thermogutta sp.]
MSSCHAFFFGTLPLALATGARAMNAIGTAVTGGMLSATFIDLMFIPLFFVLISQLFGKATRPTPPSGLVMDAVRTQPALTS